MSLPGVAEHAVSRHGRGRLNDDDAVKNQVPKRERAAQARRGRRDSRSSFHESAYWIMEGSKCQY